MSGDSAPSRGAGQNAADRPVSSLDASFGRLQGCSGQDANHGHSHLVAFGGNNQSGPIEVATARNASASASASATGRLDFETETFLVQAVGFNARQDPDCWLDRTGPLDTDGSPQAVAFAQNSRDEVREMPYVGALAAKPRIKQTSYVREDMQVRRLTPRECARLQGFPDDHLDIIYRGKPAADGPKYKALGNSMAVPCMHWIGARIDAHIKGELPSPCEAFL